QKSIEWILSVLLTSNALSVVAEVEALLVKGCRGSISSGMGSGERIKRRLATWADVARSDRLHFRQRALARTAVFPDVRCKSLAPACAAAIAELVFEAHEPPRQPGGVLTRKRSEAPAKGADDCCHALHVPSRCVHLELVHPFAERIEHRHELVERSPSAGLER